MDLHLPSLVIASFQTADKDSSSPKDLESLRQNTSADLKGLGIGENWCGQGCLQVSKGEKQSNKPCFHWLPWECAGCCMARAIAEAAEFVERGMVLVKGVLIGFNRERASERTRRRQLTVNLSNTEGELKDGT